LDFPEWTHAHLPEVGLAEARLAEDLAHRGFVKRMERVSITQGLVALPGHLNILDRVAEIVGRQPHAVSAASRLSGWRLQKVGERRERK
jgi:hypothetical protein